MKSHVELEKLAYVMKHWSGVVVMWSSFWPLYLFFSGTKPEQELSAAVYFIIAMLPLAFGVFLMSWASEDDKESLLNTPLKVKVLVTIYEKLGNEYYLATVYMNRRTGELSAPEAGAERQLKKISAEEMRSRTRTLRSPHYSWPNQFDLLHMDMLGATYWIISRGNQLKMADPRA